MRESGPVEAAREAVREAVRRYDMLRPGEKVVVAVSGGPDSLALLHLLWTLRDELGITLHVAHLDHGLRGEEAQADAEFVRGVAAGLGVPVTVGEVRVAELARVRGLSVEEAGREARYSFFREVMVATGAARVALGHNRDDQAETVLMRLLRGAGPAGLAGIPPVRGGWIIRPFLAVPRTAIEAYCREQGLSPRHDSTNEEDRFLRNRIRRDLLPLLESDYNPALRAALANLADILRAEEEWAGGMAEDVLAQVMREEEGTVFLPVRVLGKAPLALRRRLVRLAAARVGPAGRVLPFEHVEQVLALLDAGAGRGVSLAGGLTAWREAEALALAGADPVGEPAVPFAYSLPVPGRVEVPEAGLWVSAEVREMDGAPPARPGAGAAGFRPPAADRPGETHVAVLDADRVAAPLVVRNRRPGDRFWPLGLGAQKKVKEFFIDAKVPRRLRDRVPLVEAGGGVVWVVGYRVDERFRAGPATRRILVLTAGRREDG